MTTANVFDIKRFSINDGDGIRTTIFHKDLSAPLQLVPESRRADSRDPPLVREKHLRRLQKLHRSLRIRRA